MPDKTDLYSHAAMLEAQANDGLTAGQLLRKARETAGYSIDDVAHALHLERDLLLALEADDLVGLGAPVFVRGYLRSYARFVELDEEVLLQGVVPAEPEREEFLTHSQQTVVKPGASLANFLLWVLVGIVVLIGLVYILIGDEPADDVQSDRGSFVEPAAKTEPKATPADVLEEVSLPKQERVEPGPEEVSLPESAPEPATEPDPEYSLSFSFTEECWVEITDAENRLLYGLEKAGSTVAVTGKPPFRLFLGNIRGVTMRLENQPFAIPDVSLMGNNTARFSIEASDIPGAEE